MTDQDTLLISGSGKYECKVVNPNTNCPFDTTYTVLEFDCGEIISVEERYHESDWSISPNPATETITLKLTNFTIPEPIEIYNVFGSLVRSITATGASTKINIADLPDGLYYIQLKNTKRLTQKFIKQG
jgi:hypothetical protein